MLIMVNVSQEDSRVSQEGSKVVNGESSVVKVLFKVYPNNI